MGPAFSLVSGASSFTLPRLPCEQLASFHTQDSIREVTIHSAPADAKVDGAVCNANRFSRFFEAE